jgi:protoporphyrin/coproporphyrin ferrochelatase
MSMTKYIGNPEFDHTAMASTGILITNLGTPDEPTPPAVRRYLAEFLSDTRVIETTPLIWWPILHGIILRTRPKRSAHAYGKIWTENGSPLLDITRKQADAIRKNLAERIPGPWHLEIAMRYGNPSIRHALEKLKRAGVQRLLVFPLYPQYSATTTASTYDAVTGVLRTWRWLPELRMINHYHDDEAYIDALVESIRTHRAAQDKAEKLLFSFHGLPKGYFLAGDPYYCECQKTARLTAEQLELKDDEWLVSFQSRFGFMEWLQPYTDKTLMQWGKQGVDSVDVICPGFSADCLETLEEINIQNRDFFIRSGGKRYSYIPALNDDSSHIAVLSDLIIRHCQGWPEFSHNWNREETGKEVNLREERAQRMKNKF